MSIGSGTLKKLSITVDRWSSKFVVFLNFFIHESVSIMYNNVRCSCANLSSLCDVPSPPPLTRKGLITSSAKPEYADYAAYKPYSLYKLTSVVSKYNDSVDFMDATSAYLVSTSAYFSIEKKNRPNNLHRYPI